MEKWTYEMERVGVEGEGERRCRRSMSQTAQLLAITHSVTPLWPLAHEKI